MNNLTAERVPDELAVGADMQCPSCDDGELRIFLDHDGVPVHSCRLVSTRAEAENFPQGSIRLGVCSSCGFITNASFDGSLQDYAVGYEEVQTFSPRFREFMHDLAVELIERHDLREKDILEIGCGKGEFLALICELGGNRGVGIDPSVVEERVGSNAGERLTFIKDLYSERYAHLRGQFVVCRHTLEHIQPTGDFLRLLRGALRNHHEVSVFFEVPETLRILNEGAFWDIYYEHPSYFTPGSLARLFRRSGFEVTDLKLAYAGQYILLTARPVNGRGSHVCRLEEAPDVVASAISGFSQRVDATIERWSTLLDTVTREGGRIVLWGSGSKGVSFLTTLDARCEIQYVVDINPYKRGMFMPGTGQEIVAPAFLREYRPDLVIAMNPTYEAEIQNDLEDMGVSARLICV